MREGNPGDPAVLSTDRCVVLVLSCDRYRDIWSPVTLLFSRYWPDCPWPKYLASDQIPPPYTGFVSLGGGRGKLDWSSLLTRILEQLSGEYLLLFLDDFFLTAPADTDGVRAVFGEMLRLDAGHVRLVPHRRLLQPFAGSTLLGEHVRGLPYRACLQAGFWRRSLLQSLICAGESPWQFEVNGSTRSEGRVEPFLAAWRNPIPYVDVLERGKWLPRGVRLCHREGLPIDFGIRPGLSAADRWRRFWVRTFGWGVERVPQSVRRWLRSQRGTGRTEIARC